MSEHYDRHRHEAHDLAVFATAHGLPMTPERAYRAWCGHSDSMAAGWLMLDLDGERGEHVLAMLRSEEERLRAEDSDLAWRERSDVERLVAKAGEMGLGLGEDELARLWADHSATQGEEWSSVRHADVHEVLGRLQAPGASFGGP